MKRRGLCLFLAILLFTIICVPASASNISQTEENAIAYLNYESADINMKQKILTARNKIIFSETWTADGINGRIVNPDGSYTEVPEFHEIFPNDWNIPTLDINAFQENIELYNYNPAIVYKQNEFVGKLFENEVYLDLPPSDDDTEPFFTFDSTYTAYAGQLAYDVTYDWVNTKGVYQNPSMDAYYNVGYSNTDTGESYGYAVNLQNSHGFEISPPEDVTIGVRASTYEAGKHIWVMTVSATS